MYRACRIERRKFRRLEVNVSVLYHILGPEDIADYFENKEYEAETLNLSLGGVAIKANSFLPQGTVISIKIMIYELDHLGHIHFYRPLIAKGEVCSYRLVENYQYRLGVFFKDMDISTKSRLTDLVQSSLKSYDSAIYSHLMMN